MNLRRSRKALTSCQCRKLEHAWIEAARQGRPLNRMATIRPLGDLTPLDHARLVDRTWNKLGGWSRYHDLLRIASVATVPAVAEVGVTKGTAAA
jgi:hypothetical protein